MSFAIYLPIRVVNYVTPLVFITNYGGVISFVAIHLATTTGNRGKDGQTRDDLNLYLASAFCLFSMDLFPSF